MTLRNRCRIFKTVCAMLFLGMLMVSVFQKGLVNTKKEMVRTARMEVPNKYWKTDHKQTDKADRDATRRWDVTSPNCSASENVSSAEWFDSLEPNFKQFMLYRHCRYFPIIINHPEKCSSDVHLLIVIKSMITQHDRREVIRQTWGKEQEIHGKKIKTLFLLGTSSNKQEQDNHQKLLQYEDYIYGDILQWDFMDSFFNLTLKETHFLKWFSIYCNNIQYIYKGDDDIFLSVTNLLEYLESSSGVENLFAGDVLYKARPIRRKTNKYYIPESLYNKTLYPPYAGGGGFIMDGPLARRLYSTSENLELFPIDDVFLGMCLELLNVKPIKHDAFKTFGLVKNKKSKMNKEPCFYKGMIVVHKLLPQELLDMWRLVNSNLECTLKVHPLILDEKKTDSNLMETGFTK